MKTEKCYYCERPFGVAIYGTDIVLAKTKDHVIPKSKGGNNTKTNLVPACSKCNYLKDSYLPNEFADYINNFIDCYLLFSEDFINLYPIHILERVVANSEDLHCKIEPIKSYCVKQINAPIGFDVRPKKRLIKKPIVKIPAKKKKVSTKQEKQYKIPEGILWGNVLSFNGGIYNFIGTTKDGLERPVYISSNKTTVVVWHKTGGIEYKYSSIEWNINHKKEQPDNLKNIEKYNNPPIFKSNELTHHEWLHRYNLEPQSNFHYED